MPDTYIMADFRQF